MGRSYQGYARRTPTRDVSRARKLVVSHSPSAPPFYLPSSPFVRRARLVPLPFPFLFFHSALPSPPSWLPPFLACSCVENACVNRKVEMHTRACGNASRNAGQRSYGTTSGTFSLRSESCRTLFLCQTIRSRREFLPRRYNFRLHEERSFRFFLVWQKSMYTHVGIAKLKSRPQSSSGSLD